MGKKNTISGRTIDFADAFAKAFFQKSYKTILQQPEDLKKALAEAKAAKAARLKAEQETKAAKAARLKVEKEAEKEKQEQKKILILKLHSKQNLNIAEIAELLGEQEAYVKMILSKKK